MTVRLTMNYSEVEMTSVDKAIADPAVAMEQKVDGTRCMVVVHRDVNGLTFRFLGRGGKKLTHAAAMLHFSTIRDALVNEFPHFGETVLDGEILFDQGRYVIFDLPYMEVEGRVLVGPEQPYRHRMQMLSALTHSLNGGAVSQVRTEWTEAGKRSLYESVMSSGGEGVMLKHLESPYAPGQRVKHSVKVKFVKTADVIVTKSTRGRNEAGREIGAFTFAVYDHGGRLRTIGSCSAIGKPHVEVGDVIEVAYLSYFGQALIQPRMRKVRTDKAPEDCTLDQLVLSSKAVV